MQNEKTLKVLEWDMVLGNLASHATSSAGKQRCFDTTLYTDIPTIKQELAYTTEAKMLLDNTFDPPLYGIRDVKACVIASRVSEYIKNTELIDIAKTIQVSRLLKSFFSRYQDIAPSVFTISTGLFENRKLEEEILDVFDEAANLVDNASPELRRLKNSLKDQTRNLKDRLNKMINTFSNYLQESVYTQRDERYVLPVKIEHKAHVQGIVHDISTSGATIFVEPKAIVDLNNTLRETELKIDHEIRRILAELTSRIAEYADEILVALELLAEIDFIFAKAKYSIELKANEPDINNQKYISLKSMKHPILMKVIENVIPNDIFLGNDYKSLIITGSNTGGKTVVLKSTGLCVLMARAGLHVPAVEASIYPFSKMFADIGDEQSVTQSLSTFSGHMKNIIEVLDNADSDSLVILDEIGAGTDPSEGSALAQAILESLCKREARTIVTTHYGELKALAYTQSGFKNASVQFDTETLKPTYRLLIGIPGTSNAIAIAKNLGLGEDIASVAQEIYYTQKDHTGKVLEGLQDTQQQLTKEVQEAESTRTELDKLETEYGEKLDKLRIDRKKTVDVYKKKYETEIVKAKDEIRKILDEIRTSKSEKIARRSFNRLSEIESSSRESFAGDLEEIEPKFKDIDWNNIKVGDNVLIKDLKQAATLLSMPDKNKNVQIQFGSLKTTIKTKKLVVCDKKIVDDAYSSKAKKGFSFSRTQIANTLDLRGVRVEEGLDKIEKYLDDASLANLHTVYIIHGHGTGALRQAIRSYFDTSPYVAKYRPGESAEGGDGVSVVDIV